MTPATVVGPPAVPLKSVALPAEHGGWGLVAEPLVLGLAIAPSVAGLGSGVAFLGGFLLHHPLKLVLSDARRGVMYPRTRAALQVGATYAAVAAGGVTLAMTHANGPFWIPLLAATPVALLQLRYDASNRSRHLVPELAGAASLAAVLPSELLADGWTPAAAASLWAVMAGRAVGSVLYVRTRLRRDRRQPSTTWPPLVAHATLVAVAASLAVAGYLPLAAVAATLLLFARAAWGLSPWHALVRPQTVGYQELGFGVLTTLLLLVGYWTA
jgi:hypothetical protein